MPRKGKRSIGMLRLRSVEHLCHHLRTNPRELAYIAAHIDRYYHCFQLTSTGGKPRPIAHPTGRLEQILKRLNELLQRLTLPDAVHGGRRGRSNLTNAMAHVGAKALVKADIKDFFPSIKSGRVYDTFARRCQCSPDVARILTRLTTYKGALPQGSPTSMVVAALVSEPLVQRLQALADSHGGTLTQYVDDTSLSGPEHVRRLKGVVARIIEQEGFTVSQHKTGAPRYGAEKVVTGVRIGRSIGVPSAYLDEVERALNDITSSISGGPPIEPSRLHSIRAKILYVNRLDAGKGAQLRHQLRQLEGARQSQGRPRPHMHTGVSKKP